MQNLACMYYAKQSVAKEMEFDNKKDKYYKEKKKKADQTRTKSYHKESALSFFGIVFLVPFDVHGRESIAWWRSIGGGVGHLRRTIWVESVANG